MDHVAIMKKSIKMIPRIISGEKTIESRWFINKSKPFNNIFINDTIYFKTSGELINVKAKVLDVKQFENLDAVNVRELLDKYYRKIGIYDNEIDNFYKNIKDKKYCVLIFLKDIERIKEFNINKKGFGSMSAWITIDDINNIKV